MSKLIRIGVVGAGNIVKTRHLPALQTFPETLIVAVCNRSLESAEAFCKEHAPEAEPMEIWQELVSREDIDAIWIGTPPYMHSEIACYALRAGKHVFCQARMARNYGEAQLMWEASISHGSKVSMLCPPPHGMKGEKTFLRLLQSKVIGHPFSLTLRSHHGQWLDASAPAHWRQRFELSGLQVLSFGIYVEVLQRWFGDIKSVFAEGEVVIPQRGDYQVEVPDFLQVLATFKSGLKAQMSFSGVYSGDAEEVLEVNGTEGVLRYNFLTDEISVSHTDEAWKMYSIPEDEVQVWRVERDFVEAILDSQAPRPNPDFTEGLKYMQVVQAAAESMDQKMVIALR